MSPLVVETALGPGRLFVHRAERPVARLLLSHGAGRGADTDDLLALAERLPAQGVSVACFDQPWVVAGRRIATAPPTLDVGLRAAAAAFDASPPLFVGGRSAGARSAARCAAELGAAGCLAVSFPLHPPGRPERTRLPELLGAGVPTLVVQGERDPMGRPEEFPAGPHEMYVVADADHGLHVPRRAAVPADAAYLLVVERVREWIGNHLPR